MKTGKYICLCAALLLLGAAACTNLDEKVYSSVMSENYYQNKDDIIRAVFRPFEHVYCMTYARARRGEIVSDQVITPTRGSWWYDAGKWEKYHRHQYDDISASTDWTGGWTDWYTGIGQCNLVLDDLGRLDPADFGLSREEFDAFVAQLRCMRAYCYFQLIDFYGDCILTTTADAAENEKPENRTRRPRKEVFQFVESEFKDFCLQNLPMKVGSNGPGIHQGEFTKGAAAAMLVKLYLNAEQWTGTPMYEECIAMARRITGGEFGSYTLAENWWEPFDWDNENCNEVIFGFPASYGTTSWHMQNSSRTYYGRTLPYGCEQYLDIAGNGARNPQFALSPSFDNESPRQELPYRLGKVTRLFEKYPGDLRYKQYKNLTNNSREGMFFLEGKIPNKSTSTGWARNPDNQYDLYLRDQVGLFLRTAEAGTIAAGYDKTSTMGNGDFNSGLYAVKYPFYSYTGGYYIETDYTDIRLAEVIYSEAEALLRLGDATEAGRLLNSVRKRNYAEWTAGIAYEPEGIVQLDLDEMLDEWGREFLEESHRRTDLIRFGRFQEAWWDKPADADKHYELFPLSDEALFQNPYLTQNPGYEDPR